MKRFIEIVMFGYVLCVYCYRQFLNFLHNVAAMFGWVNSPPDGKP